MADKTSPISTPDLIWRDDVTPESREFGDIYFSPTDGMAESSYVFIEGISGRDFWQDKPCLSVGETGFGTGLNFLNLWHQWEESSRADQRLHFLSVEAFPLEPDAIKKALSVWPHLTPYVEKLCNAYPLLHPGIHRISFDQGRVLLTLLFGKAEEILPQVQGRVDGWFLDGFAPSQNETMWQDRIYQQLARLSHTGTHLATFTAAGHVRRGLEAAGFAMSKRPGFGKKRECLTGQFSAPQEQKLTSKTLAKTPWFQPVQPLANKSTIAIIGGGIAGFSLYQVLKSRGFKPEIFEAASDVASVGSGNLVGLVQPRLTAADSLDGRFNAAAFLHAVRHYSGLSNLDAPIWLDKRGVLQLARNEKEAKRFERLVQEKRLPLDAMRFVDAKTASELAGVTIHHPALHFPEAGCVSPLDHVKSLAKSAQKDVHKAHKVDRLIQTEKGWTVAGTARGQQFERNFDAVILANGPFADQLWDNWVVPLHAKRGQVVHFKATEESRKLNCAVAFEGYISPACDVEPVDEPLHVAGASYANFDENPSVETPKESATWRELRDKDEFEITEQVESYLPELGLTEQVTGNEGRAGLRATVPDHLAILGPLPDADFFNENYDDLHHGKHVSRYPVGKYHHGLYCLTGLGSRGVQTSPLLSEALADLLTGEPCALKEEELLALHPARFHIRQLKRPPDLRESD